MNNYRKNIERELDIIISKREQVMNNRKPLERVVGTTNAKKKQNKRLIKLYVMSK